MQTIYVKDALRQINLYPSMGDTSFAIEYRKTDGNFGKKEKCRLRSGTVKIKSDLLSIKKENRQAGKLYLEHLTADGRWQKFEIWMCLLVKFNDAIIDHRF